MAQNLQSTVSIKLQPVTPSSNEKTNPVSETKQSGDKEGKRRVKEADIDPVTFLAVEVMWMLMMPNNLGWKS